MAYISPLSLSLWERRPIRPRRGERERREPKNERNVNPKWKAGENTSRMLNNNGQLESVRGLSTALRPARDAVVWNLHPCAVVEGGGGGGGGGGSSGKGIFLCVGWGGWTRPWRIFRIPCVCVCVCVWHCWWCRLLNKCTTLRDRPTYPKGIWACFWCAWHKATHHRFYLLTSKNLYLPGRMNIYCLGVGALATKYHGWTWNHQWISPFVPLKHTVTSKKVLSLHIWFSRDEFLSGMDSPI